MANRLKFVNQCFMCAVQSHNKLFNVLKKDSTDLFALIELEGMKTRSLVLLWIHFK